MSIQVSDFLVCGGGIVGLTIARELVKRGYENIIILEKEKEIGMHASGCNSGVLHAGIYYPPDSLRARLCLKGNFLMKQYCKEKGIHISDTGKVIVARNEDDVETLKDLYNRATKNGAKVQMVDEKQLSEIEPNAKTCGFALYSYYTAVVEPKMILKKLVDDLVSSKKVKIITETKFEGINGNCICLTNKGKIKFNTFVNAAGAYSDKVAHRFGIGTNYKILPFKGSYKKLSREATNSIRGNIYPVPDIRNPFLGVHFTKSVSGDVYLGPTAIPVFKRENHGLIRGIGLEAINILYRDAVLLIANPKFREIALTEPQKYFFRDFFKDAKALVKTLRPEDVIPSDKAGIRPQLVDWDSKKLVADFLVINDINSIHILNAISPAFTSSMAFAEFIVENYIKNN